MKNHLPIASLLVAAAISLIAAGCGPSAPEHVVKPITARPVTPNPFNSFSTAEDKIRYVENSKAPQSIKDAAIARIKAGR